MKPSRFVRWRQLRDEREALKPETARYLYWSSALFILSIVLWIMASTSMQWAYLAFWPATIGFWVTQWKYMNRSRRSADLLAEMKGLAYEPH